MAKLLISDCCPQVTDSLKDFFTIMGLSVQTANSAEEIIKSAENSKPDILIMDVRLNNARRWDVVENVKLVSPGTEIIIMSTCNELEIKGELESYGIKKFMSKPIDMEKLLSIVKEGLV